jgi:mRNA interferase MazF
VVVVSHDAFNQTAGWRSVILGPLSTSAAQRSRGPTAVALRAGSAGLRRDSVALCHQVTTLDRAKLTQRIGVLPRDLAGEIDIGLATALALR